MPERPCNFHHAAYAAGTQVKAFPFRFQNRVPTCALSLPVGGRYGVR